MRTVLPPLLREMLQPGRWGRIGLLLGVYALGAWVLHHVPTTAGAPVSWPEAFYRSLRFFTLDEDRFPTGPQTGGTMLFWGVLFLAPAIIASALVDLFLFVRKHLLSPALRVQAMRAPVVVCGCGSHGRVLVEVLVEAGREVVAVDRDTPETLDTLHVHQRRVPVIRGDMVERETLRQAGVERASMVWFTAGDPMVNLKAALVARDHLPGPADRRLIPMVDEDELAAMVLRVFGAQSIEPFPQFKAAAEALVDTPGVRQVLEEQCRKSPEARVAIVGFGRFGLAVARALLPFLGDLQAAEQQAAHVVEIIDRRDPSRATELAAGFAAAGWHLKVMHCDAEEWVTRVRQEPPRVAFFCMDDDVVNLRCAARLLAIQQPVSVVLRLFNPLWPEGASPDPTTVYARPVAALLREKVRAQLSPRSDS